MFPSLIALRHIMPVGNKYLNKTIYDQVYRFKRNFILSAKQFRSKITLVCNFLMLIALPRKATLFELLDFVARQENQSCSE